MTVTPSIGYVVLEPYTQDTTSGGIHLPDVGKQSLPIGTVVEVGYGEGIYENYEVDLTKDKIKLGEIVAFQKYHESEVKWQGKEYAVVRFDKIVAKLTEKK